MHAISCGKLLCVRLYEINMCRGLASISENVTVLEEEKLYSYIKGLKDRPGQKG